MKELYHGDFDSNHIKIPPVSITGESNILKMSVSHWRGGSLDMDLDVSYDGGYTWAYGGGCKGAVSAEGGIEFHFTYQINPTHFRADIRSDDPMAVSIKMFSGE